MFNICPSCAAYRADKPIEASVAICPECGYAQPFKRFPLALITGASGTGKSTVCRALLDRETDCVLMDTDILWQPSLEEDFVALWLRMAKNINQSGRPAVLFGAGTGVPENIETQVERRYFTSTHYLALICDEAELERRLRARPAWRESDNDDYVAEHLAFNRWFIDNGRSQTPSIQTPTIHLLDTTAMHVDETVQEVEAWLLQIRW